MKPVLSTCSSVVRSPDSTTSPLIPLVYAVPLVGWLELTDCVLSEKKLGAAPHPHYCYGMPGTPLDTDLNVAHRCALIDIENDSVGASTVT